MTVVSRSQALTSASNYRKIHANHSTKGVAAMAQNYTEQLRKDNVRDAIYEDLQNNCEVLRTSWSGNAFPANPKVGQPCYRVDEDKLYYWDGYKWSQKGGGGSAELKTMELAAATSERVSITLEGARCLDKNMMFVFVDKIAQDPSTYSMNDDGTVVNFNPAIPANAAVTLRWFDTDVGTFDTAIFASDAEFAAGELTNKAPNVKQVHSLSDQIQTANANYVKSELQSNLLNYTTNRILEIPQDIKLELNNGTLTLKAGSKVYVPNGFESDGTTPKFNVVVISRDLTNTTTVNAKLALTVYNNILAPFSSSLCFSGGIAPTSPTVGTLWYDTASNKMKVYSNSIWNERNDCFPIAMITANGSSYSSIDQVFNGFGYIGSTVFALPGVKVQIPNGRNEDGTCRSIIATVDSVKTTTRTDSVTTSKHWYLLNNLNLTSSSIISFDADKNIYVNSSSEAMIAVEIAYGYLTSGKITSFEPYTVDSVVNSNKFYQLKNKAVTTDTVQTISVGKEFTAEQLRKSTVIDITIQPEKYIANNAFRFSDKNGKTSGYIENAQMVSGEITTGIHARNKDGYQSKVSVFVPLSGTTGAYAIAPTPPVNTTGEKIVTAGWFNSKMQVVSALPANPDPNVFYFIPE